MTIVILIIIVLIIIVIAALLIQSPRAAKPRLEVFTLPEAAHYLKITEQDVLQLIQSGELRARRIGNEYRIHRDRLDEIPQEWLHPGS